MSQPACMAPAWVARNIGWRTSSPDGRWKAPASQERDQRHSPNMKPVTADDSKSEEQPWQAVWTYVIAGFSGQPGTQRRARSHRTRTHCRRMVCAKRTSSSRQSRTPSGAPTWLRIMSTAWPCSSPGVTALGSKGLTDHEGWCVGVCSSAARRGRDPDSGCGLRQLTVGADLAVLRLLADPPRRTVRWPDTYAAPAAGANWSAAMCPGTGRPCRPRPARDRPAERQARMGPPGVGS